MLIDQYGRIISYLRLSLTDKCDLRCSYCIPEGFTEFEKPEHWLSFDEIEQVVRVFASLGTSRFRLTGGEPLLRKNIVDLTARLSQIDGVNDLSLSTNATQLSRYAHDLRKAGLNRLNVSLDAIDPQTIKRITHSNVATKVFDGLQAAKDAGFKRIKINMVVMKGINEDQIDPMVQFCHDNHFILRLIELMPMGLSAQSQEGLNIQPIIERLSKELGLVPSNKVFGGGPARYWEKPGSGFSIGYITPMSQHFCETCNRVRMGVDGTLYMCLGNDHEYPLKPLLRSGISDDELRQHLRQAINIKPFKHEFVEKPKKMIRIMSMTGG
ncbi:GTP 3',8-cyclase MoaA [Brackiella oedipodis]|uniref:GTP 3',8-cyclase MoaA n=1 Tax=Brackiella oedipodis TaxID=124225 RepID=UPI00048EBFF3|nr:GTP 3',8-cyclase MoaA [Brackiella oedipodis]